MRAFMILICLSGPGLAETCQVEFDLSFDEAIGSLAAETPLLGNAEVTTLEPLRQPGDGLSFTTDGTLSITGPNGTELDARIVDMHISRTVGSLDYISFNAREVSGLLGGEVINTDPILTTWYGPHGTLPGLEFPTAAEWENLTKRRAIQMRIEGTVRYHFGKITRTTVTCE